MQGARGRTKIDGYDPETMYENWKSCKETIGGDRKLRKAWDELPVSKQKDCIGRHGDKTTARNKWIQRQIMNEVETRDWHWPHGLTEKNEKVRVAML